MSALRLAASKAGLLPQLGAAVRRRMATQGPPPPGMPEPFTSGAAPRLVAADNARKRDMALFVAVVVFGWPLEVYLTR
jgi:hypothetical protein